MMKPYQTILNKYYHRGYFDDCELADLLDCSRKRICDIRKGQAELWAWELLVLQGYFSQAGRHELADLSFPEGYKMYQLREMRINGTWKDETRRGISEIVHADEAASNGSYDESISRLNNARQEIDQFEAEVKNARG